MVREVPARLTSSPICSWVNKREPVNWLVLSSRSSWARSGPEGSKVASRTVAVMRRVQTGMFSWFLRMMHIVGFSFSCYAKLRSKGIYLNRSPQNRKGIVVELSLIRTRRVKLGGYTAFPRGGVLRKVGLIANTVRGDGSTSSRHFGYWCCIGAWHRGWCVLGGVAGGAVSGWAGEVV